MNAIDRLGNILELLQYVCFGNPIVLSTRYMIYVYNSNLLDIASGLIWDDVKLPMRVVELDGNSSAPFTLSAIVSDQEISTLSEDVLSTYSDKRVIMSTIDSKFALFSDFDDFQIAMIDRSIFSNENRIAIWLDRVNSNIQKLEPYEADLEKSLSDMLDRVNSLSH